MKRRLIIVAVFLLAGVACSLTLLALPTQNATVETIAAGFILLVIVCVVMGSHLAIGIWASRKGYSLVLFTFLSLFLTPVIMFLVVYSLPRKQTSLIRD